ncbi:MULTISPECIES: PP2C family protein-serine/threonine phosphatase [Streptomyces]|uniref:PP2C family protein-serine/threonine phosphatase n=1 Tax=Streptomyces TaxID=1883 RepID=UPI0013183B63|nr:MULTISPECIES: PP2C family protein-serine/threonine phosphatase [Streptomyces]QGZ47602.1 SpoIIE family protein phosphatase [Streptomyces sp. QHH-9511]GGT78355.1 phosphatase [Streptomyces lateritius]
MVVERALRRAAPHALLEAVQDTLTAHYSADSVDLLMADYAMTILQPVSALPYTAEPIPVHTSAPGRAFGAQEPYVETDSRTDLVTVHLPISVRGDRIGILTVRMPADSYDRDTAQELEDIAEVLGHAIVVAERDTDVYLQARRADRLTLAAEMQWQLLPGRSCSRPEYELGAQLEPAYAIHGDNFDWSTSAHHLTLTVTNGMGEGIEAALLTNLAINALRNARRAGLSLSDQACLADQAIYGQYQGAVHLSVLLLRFDLATGETEIIDAGSPKMWRLRQGKAEPLELEAQLPLGMFEDTIYTPQRFQAEPGDRLLFVSDGVYDAASPAGERYSERALVRAMANTRLLPPSQVPRAVLQELSGHRGPIDADDDAMVVCLDWHGRQETTPTP